MYDLIDKVVLVTGAAKGIGAALCAEVLNEGAKHVRILDVDKDAGLKLQNELNNKYGINKAKFVMCDVTNKEQFFTALNDTKEEHDYLDLLVNNAGVVTEGNYAEIQKHIEINFIAVVNGTYKAIELMDKSIGGKGGTVLNVSSVVALDTWDTTLPVYSATKCAVLQFTNCIGKGSFYDETGVRIISLCFGVTDTPILKTINCFRKVTQTNTQSDIRKNIFQSADHAAKGAVEAYKKGGSASVWLIKDGNPPVDVSDIERKN